jgi:hypothetical protein
VSLIDEDIWGRNEGHRDERSVQGNAIGESRLRLGEEYNFEIGDNYAIGRALISLGEVLVKTANFKVFVSELPKESSIERTEALIDYADNEW